MTLCWASSPLGWVIFSVLRTTATENHAETEQIMLKLELIDAEHCLYEHCSLTKCTSRNCCRLCHHSVVTFLGRCMSRYSVGSAATPCLLYGTGGQTRYNVSSWINVVQYSTAIQSQFTKVNRSHSPGTMNNCTKFHGNPSNSSVWIKMTTNKRTCCH